MPDIPWIHNNKLVVNAAGNPVMSDICPCVYQYDSCVIDRAGDVYSYQYDSCVVARTPYTTQYDQCEVSL